MKKTLLLFSLLGCLLAGGANAQNWNQLIKTVSSQRAIPSSVGRANSDRFGFSVAIDGDYAVIGAIGEDDDATGLNNLPSAGAAYIFKKNTGTGNWELLKKIVASDRAASDAFGNSVAISGSTIVVGAANEDEDAAGMNNAAGAGSAYVFSQNEGGTNNWGQVKKIVASDRAANDNFGNSVAISGSTIVVGAYLEDHDAAGMNFANNAGSAYVFSKTRAVRTTGDRSKKSSPPIGQQLMPLALP